MSDPVTLMGDMDDLTRRLDDASRTLYVKDKELEPVEESYQELWDELLIGLIDEYEAEGKRVPGEDIREAKVRRLLRGQHKDFYRQYKEMKSEVERLEKRAKRIERQISSKQSQLSFLKTEAMATG